MHLRGLMHVFENPHDSEHRCRVNSFTKRLVIEANVTAGDRDFQFLASLGQTIDSLGELPHDVRLLRVSKVEAVRSPNRSRARTRNLTRCLSDGMLCSQLRIQVTPATVPIQRHGQPAIDALDANYSRIARTRSLDGIGLHHVVVLLPHPPLAADIRRGKKLLQRTGQISFWSKLNSIWHLARYRRLPPG